MKKNKVINFAKNMDMVLMWFLVNFNIVNDVVAKVVVNVIVVILNYILSKLVVFKK